MSALNVAARIQFFTPCIFLDHLHDNAHAFTDHTAHTPLVMMYNIHVLKHVKKHIFHSHVLSVGVHLTFYDCAKNHVLKHFCCKIYREFSVGQMKSACLVLYQFF